MDPSLYRVTDAERQARKDAENEAVREVAEIDALFDFPRHDTAPAPLGTSPEVSPGDDDGEDDVTAINALFARG